MRDYALVLTGPTLSSDHVRAVETALEAEVTPQFRALNPEKAYEWLFNAEPAQATELLQTIRAALASNALDANLVPNDQHRRKRLLIADMDSTIIEQECIDEIADFAGYGQEVAAITERAMRGELDFEDALTTRVALLKGLDTSALERVFTERLTVMPGAQQLITTMSANGAYCALVSGGFTFFTSRIAKTVGFHENRANTLEIADDKLTGRPIPPILGRQAKLDTLNELTKTHDVPITAALAVGDGANDLAMIKAAGLGVAYRAKPVVAAEADAQINHSDLTALLYLQGYHLADVVC